MSPLIEIQDLSFQYPVPHRAEATQILKNLSWKLSPGKITICLGPSGVGKSTLVRILTGLEKGATGTIKVNDQVLGFSDWDASQRVFGWIPQTPHLFPWKTVRENIRLACPEGPEANREVDEILEIVKLSDSADLYPHEISLGMAARVSFARTMVLKTQALLLDEPFAALDAITRQELQNWTREQVRSTGLPALLVTHDLVEAKRMGDDILILSGKPAQIVINKASSELSEQEILDILSR